jgi:outer membrane immunogenic protein
MQRVGAAMKRAFWAIATMAALTGGTAYAADMPVKALPPPVPTLSWTGCYIGGDVGAGWVRDSDNETVKATGAPSIFSPAPTNIATPDGVKLGGYIGCDYQYAGGFVIGALGDVQWANIRGGSAQFPNSGNPAPPFFGVTGVNDFYETRADFQASARARVGYAFNHWLVYATGGVAFLDVTEHDVLQSAPPVGAFTNNTSTRTGWTVGAGADYAFTNNWIGRVEYRYSDFGTFSYSSALFTTFTENHRITENQVLVGLHYKFGVGPIATRY